MTLDLTLKAAAILLLTLSGFQFLYYSAVPLVPVILANILFVTSIFSRSQPKRVAVIALAFAVIIPAGAFRSYVRDDTSLTIAMVNLPIFAYLAYVSWRTIRGYNESN
jgi:hypothetical protein